MATGRVEEENSLDQLAPGSGSPDFVQRAAVLGWGQRVEITQDMRSDSGSGSTTVDPNKK